ncbi:N-acetyltransferase [bacterium]|jgi:GNAT superfamily N-acetyltransferase|nr:N-acetyltransferase [bacterium]
MTSIILKTLDEAGSGERSTWIDGAREIFIETRGRNVFSSREEEQAFEWRYFGVYNTRPEWFFVALRGDSVLGYLAGTPETLPVHFELNPYLRAFEKEIRIRFPAHLHINLSATARGSGIGSLLVESFAKRLMQWSIPGIHIVTAAGERNAGFYQKNRFREIQRSARGTPTLLLMGRPLP